YAWQSGGDHETDCALAFGRRPGRFAERTDTTTDREQLARAPARPEGRAPPPSSLFSWAIFGRGARRGGPRRRISGGTILGSDGIPGTRVPYFGGRRRLHG